MSEKAVLTKEQAEAVEHWLSSFNTKLNEYEQKAELLKLHCVEGDWGASSRGMNGMSISTMAKALFIGYEVEKTPEEKLLEKYTELRELNLQDEGRYYEGVAEGIYKTLLILGITVEGIND